MHNFFINPARIAALTGHVLSRMAALKAGRIEVDAYHNDDSDQPHENRLKYENHNGIGVIHVKGGLASEQIPGWSWFADQSYDAFIRCVETAVNDPDITKVLIAFNSPGGTVTGCAEAAAKLDALSEKKEIWSHCQMADSAAYWLASATNHIIVDPTGEVGSIGVIMTHFDVSKLLEDWGVKVTHIFSGDRKADGTPYQPLSEEASAQFKADMDYLRGLFVQAVSAYRLADELDIHKTQALTYIGAQALSTGLADSTGFFSDVLKEMADSASQQTQTKETNMAKKPGAKRASSPKKSISASQTETPADDENEEDSAETQEEEEDEGAEDQTEGDENEEEEDEDEGTDTGASADKARIKTILNSPEAKGRESLAQHLALDTNMSAATAIKTLAKAEKSGGGKGLLAAMNNQRSPSIGSDAGQGKQNKLIEDMKQRVSAKK